MWYLTIIKYVHPDGTVALHHYVRIESGSAAAGLLRFRADEARDYLAAIKLGRPDSMQIDVVTEEPAWLAT